MAAGLMLRSIGKHTAGTKRQLGLNKNRRNHSRNRNGCAYFYIGGEMNYVVETHGNWVLMDNEWDEKKEAGI